MIICFLIIYKDICFGWCWYTWFRCFIILFCGRICIFLGVSVHVNIKFKNRFKLTINQKLLQTYIYTHTHILVIGFVRKLGMRIYKKSSIYYSILQHLHILE